MNEKILIRAGEIYTPEGIISPGSLLIDQGKIDSIYSGTSNLNEKYLNIIDVPDSKIIPGFIDTHVHGRLGNNFGDDIESTRKMLYDIARTGVTSLLPTIGAKPEFDQILEAIKNVIHVKEEKTEGAEILGIHMEGPYFSKEKYARGSQPVQFLRSPSVSELHKMFEISGNNIKKLSIAPELDGAIDVIKEASALGIVVCMGHSSATFRQAIKAIDAGASCATHTFNGMAPFHHRKPGLIGAILTRDEINAEFIPDGQHISPTAIEILLRCKGIDNMHAVSDNTIYAGLPEGEYEDKTKSRIVVKEKYKAYVKGGTLAGSVCELDYGLRILIQRVGLTLEESVKLLCENPALVVKEYERKGSLEAGKDADLLIIDEEFHIQSTFVNGKAVL